jgi:flagellar biosynthesis protein FliQ
MDSGLLSVVIIDGILLVVGCFMSIFQKKFKINQKAIDIVWKLVEYVTIAIVGYQFGSVK